VGPVENVVQLVTQPQLRDRLWWPGALLTDSAAKAKALKDYQHVMAQLASWEAEADDDVAATIKSVRQQLLNLNITGRLPVKLDPDFVRVDENSNPPLVGDYTLYTVQRPVTITLLGAVSGAGQLPWQAGRSVTDYLQDHPRLAGADKNNVMVITPEGETVVAPVALWNKRHVEPPPGSQLWLGFSAHVLPEKYADLNDQIVSVLTQRVPD
ncbi:TPA: capsule biosynthesis GfcC D2 domain-containing protein, partial [Escherichia coli]|nr:capsule biosynthesis GfcC family protein [Escherichia coli]